MMKELTESTDLISGGLKKMKMTSSSTFSLRQREREKKSICVNHPAWMIVKINFSPWRISAPVVKWWKVEWCGFNASLTFIRCTYYLEENKRTVRKRISVEKTLLCSKFNAFFDEIDLVDLFLVLRLRRRRTLSADWMAVDVRGNVFIFDGVVNGCSSHERDDEALGENTSTDPRTGRSSREERTFTTHWLYQ